MINDFDYLKEKKRLEAWLVKAKDPACSFEEAAVARKMADKLIKKLGLYRGTKEKIFLKGLYAKEPKSKPPWVLFDLVIHKEDFIQWLQKQDGDWVHAQVCRSKTTDKWYAEVDQWKPKDV